MSYTYILRLADGEYYVGSTHNLQRRIKMHNEGTTRFTSIHLPVTLVYYEEYEKYEDALKREKQLKGWSRVKKIRYARFPQSNVTTSTPSKPKLRA